MVEASDGTHKLGPHRGIRLKQRGTDTNSDGEYEADVIFIKADFATIGHKWVALFNVTSK